MNTQNILKFYGSKLDIKLDSSEFYDYELSKVEDDYNKEAIDFTTPIVYSSLTVDSQCLNTFLNNEIPWDIEINTPYSENSCDFTVRRRTERGWTLDFVINRDDKPWSNGGVFYYWGITNEFGESNFADNNLSFRFTNDGRIEWRSYRYSGTCDPTMGYSEDYLITSGRTDILCSLGTLNDFNLTIVFERDKVLENCDVYNKGGSNDLIRGPHLIEYTPEYSAVTSTDIMTGYTITNQMDVILSGATPEYSYVEELNHVWDNERKSRLGTLKIYLNGKPIYKLKGWEEIIPSLRSSTNTINQIFGGGTTGFGNYHSEQTQFVYKRAKYFEEPLGFPNIKHHYRITKPNYDISECFEPCVDDINGFTLPPPPPLNNNIIIDANFSPGSTVIVYTATSDNPVSSNTTLTFDNIIELYDGTSILIRVSITILQGDTVGTYTKILGLLYNDVKQDVCKFTNFVSSGRDITNIKQLNTFVFNDVIPEEQDIIDAIITDDDLIYHDNQLYISAGDNVYIRFVDPPTP